MENIKKVGLVYDLSVNDHNSGIKAHVECPDRLINAIKIMVDNGTINDPNLEVVSTLNECSLNFLKFAHNPNYIEFIENMWPEESEK